MALLAMIFFASPPLRAAIITVNSTADSSGNPAICTLRDAITNANGDNQSGSTGCVAGFGADLIDMTGITGTITLTSNLPKISTDISIVGPGASDLTIDGANTYRIFFVDPGVIFNLSSFRVYRGFSRGGNGGNGVFQSPLQGGGGGGAAGAGGAIFINSATLLSSIVSADNIVFDTNSATGGNGGDALVISPNLRAAGGGGGFDGNDGADGNGATGVGGKGGDGGYLGGTGGAGTIPSCTPAVSGSPDGAGGGGGGNCLAGVNGGSGSEFGGGGGAISNSAHGTGGNGGIGGGGGGGNPGGLGGPGGFGGDGESACVTDSGAGGGGAGLGGAVFIRSGSIFNFGSCTFTGNGALGGTGGSSICLGGSQGKGKAGAIFVDDLAEAIETCPNIYDSNSAFDSAGTPTDNNDIFIFNGGTFKSGTDVQNPIIECPADLEVSNDLNLCSAVVDPGKARATDNCAVKSIEGVRSDALPLTDPYPVGTTFITWTATDYAGKTDVCLQQVTVKDTQPPTVTCTGDQTVSADASCLGVVPNFVASYSDNCPGLVVVQAPAAGSTVGLGGPTLVVVTATDASGNIATCSANLTVNDTTPPVVTSSTVIHILSSDHTMKDVGFSAVVHDNCDPKPAVTVAIYSNENEELKTSSGDARTSPDARGIGTDYNYGKWEDKLALRQERVNNGQGRVYLIKVSATDLSGNTGYSCSYVISPKSSKRRDIQTAQNLGDAVVGPCSATGLVPLNYLLNPIGFGPEIGNKQ